LPAVFSFSAASDSAKRASRRPPRSIHANQS
jgi:hypothetical protein